MSEIRIPAKMVLIDDTTWYPADENEGEFVKVSLIIEIPSPEDGVSAMEFESKLFELMDSDPDGVPMELVFRREDK